MATTNTTTNTTTTSPTYSNGGLDLKDEQTLSCDNVPHPHVAVLGGRQEVFVDHRVSLDISDRVYNREGEVSMLWQKTPGKLRPVQRKCGLRLCPVKRMSSFDLARLRM